ncbi:thioredoxin [Candidatus Woesearchaeota archaeon]|nr:thioredoxin [Candidatus Woesearchaeota archaeon]
MEVNKMVMVLNSKSFQTEISKDTPIIVDFWASWCGPCRMMAPVFEELSKEKEFAGKLRFAKLSTEEEPNIAEKQGITGIPCLILFKKGEEVDRIIGAHPKEELKGKIEKLLR